jgi:hypothetical protein
MQPQKTHKSTQHTIGTHRVTGVMALVWPVKSARLAKTGSDDVGPKLGEGDGKGEGEDVGVGVGSGSGARLGSGLGARVGESTDCVPVPLRKEEDADEEIDVGRFVGSVVGALALAGTGEYEGTEEEGGPEGLTEGDDGEDVGCGVGSTAGVIESTGAGASMRYEGMGVVLREGRVECTLGPAVGCSEG